MELSAKIKGVNDLAKREVKPKGESASTENMVFIGKKPIMSYVTACITFFNRGEEHVIVKARGRAISRAVDSVELLRRAFIQDLEIKSIKIGTEEFIGAEGKKSNVSTIEIVIAKSESAQPQPQEN
jgi:DNA-binding protein